jgi:ubiquinone/menaquinone biosynthesis C-methylase UbiE
MPLDPQQAKEKSRQVWDNFAPLYDKYVAPTTSQAARRVVDLANVKPGQRVLDIATGTGVAAFAAAERVGSQGRVVGVDFSEGILSIAQDHRRARNLDHVELRPMDAENLQFSDKTFDAATCCLGLMLFPQPMVALAEMKRVLKSESQVSLAVWGSPERMVMGTVFPILRKYLPDDIPESPPPFAFAEPGAIESVLIKAGFVKPRAERHFYQMNWVSLEIAWELISQGGPVSALIQKLPSPQQALVKQEILERLTPFKSTKGLEVPFELVFGTAKSV